jgi:hypothetical protein
MPGAQGSRWAPATKSPTSTPVEPVPAKTAPAFTPVQAEATPAFSDPWDAWADYFDPTIDISQPSKEEIAILAIIKALPAAREVHTTSRVESTESGTVQPKEQGPAPAPAEVEAEEAGSVSPVKDAKSGTLELKEASEKTLNRAGIAAVKTRLRMAEIMGLPRR